MFKIDVMSEKPIYEQIIEQVEQFILIGILNPNDKIPSVRSMATKLLVNPNTIQKAYSELDNKGIICSVPGRGCFVSEEAVNILNKNKREKLSELEKMVFELAIAQVEKKEINECVDRAYEKKEKLGND
ncbi:GntR family transcriptional regulator [Lachnospiraceae bacterium RM5]|nr:GntR family transcriptional regulator [Lachnospiraceae bacterium RM5]